MIEEGAKIRLRRSMRMGVIWWGIPTAFVMAYWIHGARFGFEWRRLLTKEFFVVLVVCLVIMGLAGSFFGRIMHSAEERLFDRKK